MRPPAYKNKIKSILTGDGAAQIREMWITYSSQRCLMDPISHTQAHWLADKIRGVGGQELRKLMNMEVGSGSSFLASASSSSSS